MVRDDQAREDERATTEEARRRSGAGGVETDAPSYAEETGTTDLGVEEPVVSPGKMKEGADRSSG